MLAPFRLNDAPRRFATRVLPWLALLVVVGCQGASAPPVALPSKGRPTRAPDRPTPPAVRFVDVTAESGVRFVHENGASGQKLLPETMGSGVAILDFDGDGDEDLFFVNSRPWPDAPPSGKAPPTQALYRNDGTGHFVDVTAEAGLALSVFGQGVAVGDYDNDGDPDLYLSAVGPGHLLRNDGGHFVDVTAEAHAAGAGGWQTSACWFDLENDGDLDLFIAQYLDWTPEADRARRTLLPGGEPAYNAPSAFGGTTCTLLRNDGGHFVDVGEASGISVRAPSSRRPLAKSLGVAPCDVDGDGRVDLAVANDTVRNFFFHNRGGGRFEEVGILQGLAFDSFGDARGAMGLAWGDAKGDGAMDLAVANFAGEVMGLYIAEGPHSMQFNDEANLLGLGEPTRAPMKFGLIFLDYDLDGRLDLLSANGHLESAIARVAPEQSHPQAAQLFWNSGTIGRNLFVPVGPDTAGPDLFRPMVGRGSASGDLDGDGDLDVVLTANGGTARILRNDGRGGSIAFRLRLVGTASNKSVIGARVVLRAGGRDQRRQLFPATGYLSSSERTMTFGLGESRTVETLVVNWPSGRVSRLANLEGGRTLTLTEPPAPSSERN